MTVSGSSLSTSATGGTDSTSLKRQLATLQKQLATETDSKDDAKTKEAKEQALQLEIQQTEAQIATASPKEGDDSPTAPKRGLPTYA